MPIDARFAKALRTLRPGQYGLLPFEQPDDIMRIISVHAVLASIDGQMQKLRVTHGSDP
jgi:hypothetical protein